MIDSFEKARKQCAEALANNRAMRKGAPPIVNVLDILPENLKAEVFEDVDAVFKVIGYDEDSF